MSRGTTVNNVLCRSLPVALFLIAVAGWAAITEAAYRLPDDRAVAWQGNVGVEGGIPARSAVRNCAVSDGAKGDGAADDTAAIKDCITNTDAGSTAYLPPGIYRITDTISLNKGITLRGAGPDKTIIRAESDITYAIAVGAGGSPAKGIDLVSGYTKGSTRLTLADADDISAGDFVRVDELNDPSIPVSASGDGGTCTWCSRENGNRARSQIVQVTAKEGNAITITPPFFFTFSSRRAPQAQKLRALTQYAGVEDLTIQNGAGTGSGKRINLRFTGAANSWARNIKINTCGKRCIEVATDNYRIEIRDSYITKCIDRVNSDSCYGTLVATSSGCLVENNIYDGTADSVMLAWGASGNVVAYNYSHDVHRTHNQATWFWPTTWSHGAHTSYNLWEGNDDIGLNWDNYWGTNSHNTTFRNRLHGKDETVAYKAGFHQNVGSLITGSNNRYMNVIGNVLGTSGWSDTYEANDSPFWRTSAIYALGQGKDEKVKSTMLRHMNFDYATKSVKYCSSPGEPGCQGGGESKELPASFYLASKPDWWGSRPWPGIGPDVRGYAVSIPARDRYLGKAPAARPAPPRELSVE